MNKYLAGALSLVSLAVGVFVGAFGVMSLQKNKKYEEFEKAERIPEKEVYKKIGEVVITNLDLSIAKSVPGINQTQEDVDKSLTKLALFYNEGKRLGLDRDSITKRLQYWAGKSVVAEAYYRKYILPHINVDTVDVMDFINQHKDEFSREVAMLTVVFQDTKMADTIMRLLKDGSYAANLMLEEFARSGKISVQPSGYQNVGLGRFALTEEEYKSLRDAKEGDVLGPFTVGPQAYVMAKVVDVRRVSPKEIDANVKNVVYQFLLDKRRKQVEDSVYTVLLNKYKK